MSRATSLTCQTKKLNIVIRKNVAIKRERLEAFCNEWFTEWAFIEHAKDIEPNSGIVEGIHYHIVANAKDSRIRLSTRLNHICEAFHFDNANGIQIEQYRTFEGSLQYLIHLNQPEKTQHEASEICTNLSKEEFNLYMTANVGEVITFDRLFASVVNARNIIDVIHDLGIKAYKDWRNVIWDIWRCQRDIDNNMTNSEYVK